MKITFAGAAETVTGSCHLVEVDGLRILLDCGLFQGGRERRDMNRDPFPFDPKAVDFALLSHAHLDHCGRLPLLIQQGFQGKILCTAPTADIAKLILVDSASLQMKEAEYRARKAKRRGETAEPPLYDIDDVMRTVDRFRPIPGYNTPVELASGVKSIFHDAGHILGSAAIELQTSNGTVLFSGDLGNRNQPIVKDPCMPPKTDIMLIESTYGNRAHKSMEDTLEEFRSAIHAVIPNDGNLLIPSFALERTQEVLYEIFNLWKAKELPRCRIFLDSPLAISTTKVFARYREYYDKEGQAVFSGDPNPFKFTPLRFTQTTDESKQINRASRGNIIIAGSGMCTGGRIIHHLRHNLWHADSGILFVGYQAVGTRGRHIVDGAEKIRIWGEDIAVRAKVWTTNGFSSHADQPILLDWIRQGNPEHLILVHGEDDVLDAFAAKIQTDLSKKPIIAKLTQRLSL